MKPFLAVFRYIYILGAKVLNKIVSAVGIPRRSKVSYTHPFWLICLLGLLTLSLAQSHGTAEFVIRNSSKIIASADSRALNTDGTIDPTPACKLMRFNNIFVAFNGIAQDYDFNAFAIVRRVMPKRAKLEDKLPEFETV